jgi:hypothetical protein
MQGKYWITYISPLSNNAAAPCLCSVLFSHCFARSICQLPPIGNILHLSRHAHLRSIPISQFIQLLSCLAKSFDFNSQLLFPPSSKATLQLQSPPRRCSSETLLPTTHRPELELPRLNWYPTTATLLNRTWTLHAVASHSGICTWRLSALALRCITRATRPRRHRLFNSPSRKSHLTNYPT